MLYFYKELGESRPIVINGETMRFEFLELDESDPKAPHLLNAARKQLGGVVVMDKESWGVKKKKLESRKPLKRQREEVTPKSLPYARRADARHVVNVPASDPVLMQTPSQAAIIQDFSGFKPEVRKGVLS